MKIFSRSPVINYPQIYLFRARRIIRDGYYKSTWAEVYDFIEFIGKFKHEEYIEVSFTDDCNRILNREFAGYIFVSGKIIPRISDQEISEIEKAMNSPLDSTNEHIKQALSLMSNRDNPDYRNSIKESISAVESICQKIAGSPNATLGDALNLITKQGKLRIPRSLVAGFDKLYGYSSSSQGIRHALPSEIEDDASQEEALFMLSSCSAFVNYLIVKSEKSQIALR
jgi:AbiJ N-terminal domain 4